MNVLIIEDEARIARRLLRMTRAYFGDRLQTVTHRDDLAGGRAFLAEHPVELLLLDLNLNGANGFEVLKDLAAAPFDTIIVSAYRDRAIEAFEYGVLDFVPKPFNRERLHQAFGRLQPAASTAPATVRHLAVRKRDGLHLIPVAEVRYVRGAGDYAELVLADGTTELHGKTLDQLARLLPDRYFRMHRSYLVDLRQIRELRIETGSKYTAILHDETELPVGRTRYRDLRDRLG